MKKRFALILFGLLIVAMSAPVYAQFEWKVSGLIDSNAVWYNNFYSTNRIYGNYADTQGNTAPNTGSLDKDGNYFNTRGRFKFDAAMGKEVTGTMFFEMDSARWGETAGGRNQLGKWQGDQVAVEVKNLFIDFAIPYIGIPVPMTARVGLQPLVSRAEMAVNTDGTGVTLGFKLDPVTVSPYWAKASHYKDYASDDVDVYGTNIIARVGRMTLGGYGVFYNMRTYPLTSVSSSPTVDPSFKGKMYWFGGYADGKLGPLNMMADFVYDWGKVESFGAAAAKDVDYRGWAARLNLALPIEMFEFGTRLMYATGSDQKDTDGTGLPGRTTPWGTTTKEVKSYVIPPGSEENSSYGANGSGIFYSNPITGRTPDFTGSNASSMSRGAIGGTWQAQLYASMKVAPWYKITVLGQYIGDTTDNGNTVGTARKANGNPRDDSDIGWEMGLFNEIQIYKNLSWGTVLSYMVAGDALDWQGTGGNVEMSNPWFIGSIIKYTW